MIYFPTSPIWAVEDSAVKTMIDMFPGAYMETYDNDDPSDLKVSNGVAYIPVRGFIEKRRSRFGMMYGDGNTIKIKALLIEAVGNDDIHTIVLVVDSPGGTVDGIAEVGDAIKNATGQKTVIAQVDGQAASAAYWIASQATLIYAGRMDLIGSIGVRMMLYDYSEMFEKEGVKAISIDTGEHKAVGARGLPVTEEQIKVLQDLADGFHDDFINAIASGRGMDVTAVKAFADGRMFKAPDALKNGLIDGIQSLEDTVSNIVASRRDRRRAAVAVAESNAMIFNAESLIKK